VILLPENPNQLHLVPVEATTNEAAMRKPSAADTYAAVVHINQDM